MHRAPDTQTNATKLSEAGTKKRKRIVDKIDDPRVERHHLTTDIAELQPCPDEFGVKDERSRDFSMITNNTDLEDVQWRDEELAATLDLERVESTSKRRRHQETIASTETFSFVAVSHIVSYWLMCPYTQHKGRLHL